LARTGYGFLVCDLQVASDPKTVHERQASIGVATALNAVIRVRCFASGEDSGAGRLDYIASNRRVRSSKRLSAPAEGTARSHKIAIRIYLTGLPQDLPSCCLRVSRPVAFADKLIRPDSTPLERYLLSALFQES